MTAERYSSYFVLTSRSATQFAETLTGVRGFSMDWEAGQPLDFVWDDAMFASNELKHGIKFDWAADVFFDWYRVDFDVSREDQHEVRRKVVGAIEGILVTVVYTPRAGGIRLISARKANSTEVRRYARQIHS